MTREEIKNIVRHVFHFYEVNAEKYNWADMNEACGEILKALEQEPCEDCISRKAVIEEMEKRHAEGDYITKGFINSLPSVTPQEPKTWSLDDARENFMSDVYNVLDFLSTNNEANRIIDSFDRVTSGIKQESMWVPVSEKLPTQKESIANNGLFIVSDGNRTYTEHFDAHNSMKYFGETTMSGFRIDRCVTAWMPLPKPYKAESEDKE